MVSGEHPSIFFTPEELRVLANHVTSWRKKEKGEKLNVDLNDPEVTHLLEIARSMGYYPDMVNEHGRLIWGCALKGDVQLLMERKSEFYHQRGLEVKGGFKSILDDTWRE